MLVAPNEPNPEEVVEVPKLNPALDVVAVFVLPKAKLAVNLVKLILTP